MGLKDLLQGGAPGDETSPVVTPYTGEPFPEGTFGACPAPGELEVALPAGRVEVHYYCAGRPTGYSTTGGSGNSKRWDLPNFVLSLKPADAATQRLSVRKPRMANSYVKKNGYSHKIALVLDVPKPGGRYRAVIGDFMVSDHEAHVRFTD